VFVIEIYDEAKGEALHAQSHCQSFAIIFTPYSNTPVCGSLFAVPPLLLLLSLLRLKCDTMCVAALGCVG
jgi:hypothetical protein